MATATPAAIPPIPWGEVDALVKSACRKFRSDFEDSRGAPYWPDLCRDDLRQHAMTVAMGVFSKFDQARGSFSTLLYNAIQYRFRDLRRGRGREGNRVRAICPTPNQPGEDRHLDALTEIRDWYEAGEGAGLPGGMGGDDETDDAWLRKVYEFAQGVFDDRRRGPRPGRIERGVVVRVYSRAQRVAVALLMRKRGLSTRGAKRLFKRRGTMRRAMGFEVTPSHWWFSKARRTVRRIFGETAYTCENN